MLTISEAHKKWIMSNFPDMKCKVFTLSGYSTGESQEVVYTLGQSLDFHKKFLAPLDLLIENAIKRIVTEKLYAVNKIGMSSACAP